jgi:uncharacterized protein (DUF2267 family)
MDEIIKMVAQRTGLSEDKARQAVDTVVSQLKQRLPGPVASQIDAALAGGGSAGGIADAAKAASGILGR